MDIVVKKIGDDLLPILQTLGCMIVVINSLMLFITAVYAQDVKVAADINPRHIQLNEKATLELKISGNTQMNHIGSPTFNFLPDFLAVPLHSKTTPRLDKNKINVTMAWVYELIPQKIGEIALSDVQFSYQGVPYVANPGKIIVGAVDTYVNHITGSIHKVQAEVTKNKPYVDEPIIYRFRYLYTTILPSLDPPKPILPKFSEFLVEELPMEKGDTVQMQGNTFKVQEYVKRLYPKVTGRILIQPAKMILPMKGNTKTLITKSLPLNIQPLPEIGKPNNFTGAIGEYDISAKLDNKKIEVRKAVTLSLQITGDGNINTINAPNIPTIKGFRIDPHNIAMNTIDNTRVFTYVLTPLKAGVLLIPAIEYSFFNTDKHTYQTSKTNPIPITVVPPTSEDVKIETDFPSWVLWFIFTLLLIVGGVIGGVIIFRSRSKQGSSSNTPDTPVTPADQALSLINTIESEETSTTDDSFVEILTRNLHQYLCKRQGISYRQLNTVEVEDICTQIRIPNSIRKELIDILTKCEYHRYAPVPLSADEQKELLSRMETVIHHIEEP